MKSVTAQQSMISNIIGENVIIQCTVILTTGIGPNVSSLIVNWYKDSGNCDQCLTQEPFNSNVIHSEFISTLSLTRTTVTDAGIYTCSASIIGSSVTLMNNTTLCIKGIFIQSYHLIKLISVSFNTGISTLTVGSNTNMIQCVDTHPLTNLTITWHNSSGIVTQSNTVLLPTIIPSLNNTKYTCTVNVTTNPMNCLGQEKYFTLFVKGLIYKY